MQSLQYLYRIGRDPSSSHTMGPLAAAKRFLTDNPNCEEYRVILYGSLAKTGKGHMTDTVLYEAFKGKNFSVEFDEITPTEFHPNMMDFIALNNGKVISRKRYYSVGGGEVLAENESKAEYKEIYSVSKWKARVLPSFKDYVKNNGKLPRLITFSFAALLAFYSSNDLREDGLYAKRANGDEYVIHDDKAVLEFFAENGGKPDFIEKVCKNTDFWNEDLSEYEDFTDTVSYWYGKLRKDTKSALIEVLK